MSTNISKQKRDALLDKINQIKNYISAAPQDENTANLLAYIGELTKEINGKKYGLVFEEHREKIDELLEENAPVLVEQEDLFIDNGGEMNFLIEGDNLAALKLLEKTHKGKIDVIYIDPPYNTGDEDFIYDDCYVDKTDEFKHSKWLSFLQKRLLICKNLLSSSGIILISIDEHERSVLKILSTEIFGENNFLCDFIRKTKSMTGDDKNGLNIQHDNVLVFAKNADAVFVKGEKKSFSAYSNPDNDVNGDWCPGDPSAKSGGESTYFAITNPITGQIDYPPKGRYWAFSQTTYHKYVESGRIKFKDTIKKNQRGFIFKRYKNNLETDYNPVGSLFASSNEYLNQVATIELESFIFKQQFSYPKPTLFIKKLIEFTTQKNSTILDFFAGSGTTGHAVMKLNAEDGGNRKFILCTNNQNNICRDITYERLRTVITGKRKDGSDYNESYPASLKYFKIDYLPIKDKMYYEYADELLEHVKELVELENAIDFNSNKSVAIVLDDDELDDFVENISDYPECKTLYMGHDVLTSYQQEQTINAHGITINTVPDYYYRDLAN